MICAYVLIGSCDRFGFRTTTLNRNALYKVVRDCICFDSLFFVAGQEKLRRRLKQSDEKTSNKNDLIICVFLSFSQFTCFSPSFHFEFLLAPYGDYFGFGFTTLNRNWLNGGITLAQTYLQRKDRRRGLTGTGTSNYLYLFG